MRTKTDPGQHVLKGKDIDLNLDPKSPCTKNCNYERLPEVVFLMVKSLL